MSRDNKRMQSKKRERRSGRSNVNDTKEMVTEVVINYIDYFN